MKIITLGIGPESTIEQLVLTGLGIYITPPLPSTENYMSKALMTGVQFTLQDAQTGIGNGEAVVLVPSFTNFILFVLGVGTITGGTIVFEEANDPDYSGTWSPVGASIDCTTVSAGKQVAVHGAGYFCALRARISVAITGGGNVTAILVAR